MNRTLFFPIATLLTLLFLSAPTGSALASLAGAACLQIPPSARFNGLGQSGVALADDATAAWWNPAGLGFMTGRTLGLMHSQLVPDLANDIYYEYAGWVQQLEGWGTYSFSLIYLSYGESVKTSDSPDPEGTFTSYEFSPALSYGVHLDEQHGHRPRPQVRARGPGPGVGHARSGRRLRRRRLGGRRSRRPAPLRTLQRRPGPDQFRPQHQLHRRRAERPAAALLPRRRRRAHLPGRLRPRAGQRGLQQAAGLGRAEHGERRRRAAVHGHHGPAHGLHPRSGRGHHGARPSAAASTSSSGARTSSSTTATSRRPRVWIACTASPSRCSSSREAA